MLPPPTKFRERREFNRITGRSIARGRSLQDLIGFLSEIHTAGIDLFLHQQGLETTTAGWKRELGRLEDDLAPPRLRYSDRNRFRDERLRVRSAVQEVPKASGTLFPR
jgi:hypothetical protein